MSTQAVHPYEGIPMTEDEYLASEPKSEVKREYIDGKVYAMSAAALTIQRFQHR